MNVWIIILVFVLVLDTVVSFIALFIAFTNKGKILKNKIQIALNRDNIMKLFREKENDRNN